MRILRIKLNMQHPSLLIPSQSRREDTKLRHPLIVAMIRTVMKQDISLYYAEVVSHPPSSSSHRSDRLEECVIRMPHRLLNLQISQADVVKVIADARSIHS